MKLYKTIIEDVNVNNFYDKEKLNLLLDFYEGINKKMHVDKFKEIRIDLNDFERTHKNKINYFELCIKMEKLNNTKIYYGKFTSNKQLLNIISSVIEI